jgi:protein-tyrosine phosphatase
MAEHFLARDMVHCIGSDAHSSRNRNPDLSATAEKLNGLVGGEKARQILTINPKKMIESQDVEIFEIKPLPQSNRAGILNRLFMKLGIY